MEDEHALGKALARSHAFGERVERDSPRDVSRESLPFLVGTVFVTFMQHHRSIRLLTEDGQLDASARALLRVLLETGYRALWLIYMAHPARVSDIDNGRSHYPKLHRHLGQKLFEMTGRFEYVLHLSDLDILNDLVHTGPEQTERHYSPQYGIRAHRDVSECITVLNRSTDFAELIFEDLLPILRR